MTYHVGRQSAEGLSDVRLYHELGVQIWYTSIWIDYGGVGSSDCDAADVTGKTCDENRATECIDFPLRVSKLRIRQSDVSGSCSRLRT